MNLAQTMAFIHATSWQGSRLGLERTRELMRRLGNPQNDLRFVHVAGTNGKGSVCSMLSSVLRQAGYRTGLYTSPYLYRFNERMQCDGEDVTDGELIALAEQMAPVVAEMDEKPTEFELITAMAFLYFQQKQCDVVVLEVGLGGRLDATNVIAPPETAVITNIGLEHTEVLGDTLEKIAGEKAGILKAGSPVVLYGQSGEVEAVVRQRCAQLGCALTVTDVQRQQLVSADLTGQTFHYRDRANVRLGLLGTYQYHNAAVALDTVDMLRGRGWTISEEAIRRGLEQCVWPGRFEVLCRSPLTLVDGAHNPNGMEELAACLGQYLPGKKPVVLLGVMADKNHRRMVELIAPFAGAFVTVTPNNPRALSARDLKAELETVFPGPVTAADTVTAGLEAAVSLQGSDGILCACGSLYLVGDVRAYFGKYSG